MLCFVATTYTTPWDNYLVYAGVWGYEGAATGTGQSSVLFTIGLVPVEEYMFFTIETLIVCL